MAEGAKHVMLEANGMALNAVDMGVQDMPAIVLLAGWPQTLRAWRFVQPTLRREGYRVIAIDPPGIGGSDLLPEGEMADTAGVADRIVAASAPRALSATRSSVTMLAPGSATRS